MSEIKLKPCPICGRTDVYSEFKHIWRENIFQPNGQTVGEYIGPQVEQAYLTGNMPPLLPVM